MRPPVARAAALGVTKFTSDALDEKSRNCPTRAETGPPYSWPPTRASRRQSGTGLMANALGRDQLPLGRQRRLKLVLLCGSDSELLRVLAVVLHRAGYLAIATTSDVAVAETTG